MVFIWQLLQSLPYCTLYTILYQFVSDVHLYGYFICRSIFLCVLFSGYAYSMYITYSPILYVLESLITLEDFLNGSSDDSHSHRHKWLHHIMTKRIAQMHYYGIYLYYLFAMCIHWTMCIGKLNYSTGHQMTSWQ